MSTTMLMTAAEIQAEGGREKWLELRTTGIGGSDAGIIVGVNTPTSQSFSFGKRKLARP